MSETGGLNQPDASIKATDESETTKSSLPGEDVNQADIGNFIQKEKGEVYLLIDFLSGRADRKIRDEKISVPASQSPPSSAPSQLVERSLIDEVCSVRWPPAQLGKESEAETAAILLKARDRLSEIASPASGASIAFTIFVTSQMSRDASQPQDRANVAKSHAILSNAILAYPQYESLARSFNRRRKYIGLALPICLAVTIISSFLISYLAPCPSNPTPAWSDMFLSLSISPFGLTSSESTPACASLSLFLNIFQVQGLPILYGLVGSLAGVLRSIQTKIRDGLLMPRDRLHIFIQLWLGVVMGATIGLFFKGGSTQAQTLGSPALSFVAGLGVDSVFLWLESLIKTLFGDKQSNSAT